MLLQKLHLSSGLYKITNHHYRQLYGVFKKLMPQAAMCK